MGEQRAPGRDQDGPVGGAVPWAARPPHSPGNRPGSQAAERGQRDPQLPGLHALLSARLTRAEESMPPGPLPRFLRQREGCGTWSVTSLTSGQHRSWSRGTQQGPAHREASSPPPGHRVTEVAPPWKQFIVVRSACVAVGLRHHAASLSKKPEPLPVETTSSHAMGCTSRVCATSGFMSRYLRGRWGHRSEL